MRKSSLLSQGSVAVYCLWICTAVRNVAQGFQTVHKTRGYYVDDVLRNDQHAPAEPSIAQQSLQYGDGTTNAAANPGAATAGLRAQYTAGAAGLRGSSVTVRQGPEGFATDDDGTEFGGDLHPGFGAQLAAGGPAGPLPLGFGAFLPLLQQQQSLFDYPVATSLLGGDAGLLQRLLFGQAAAANPFDRYLSFCNRMSAVGRFLGRLFRPLFTAGFYMAASYVLRRSVLPSIAHYLHSYAAATDTVHGGVHHGHGRLGDGDRLSRDLRHVLTTAVTDVVYDAPCLRKIACETGLRAASNPIARSIQRMAKQIISNHELSQSFEKSITGFVSECNQYVCKTKTKAKL